MQVNNVLKLKPIYHQKTPNYSDVVLSEELNVSLNSRHSPSWEVPNHKTPGNSSSSSSCSIYVLHFLPQLSIPALQSCNISFVPHSCTSGALLSPIWRPNLITQLFLSGTSGYIQINCCWYEFTALCNISLRLQEKCKTPSFAVK